jgi:hypothetical protein
MAKAASYRRADNKGEWVIDRHIPVVWILGLLLQTMTIVWWAATMNGRVINLESAVMPITSQEQRITILETKWQAISADLVEIKSLLRVKNPTR